MGINALFAVGVIILPVTVVMDDAVAPVGTTTMGGWESNCTCTAGGGGGDDGGSSCRPRS